METSSIYKPQINRYTLLYVRLVASFAANISFILLYIFSADMNLIGVVLAIIKSRSLRTRLSLCVLPTPTLSPSSLRPLVSMKLLLKLSALAAVFVATVSGHSAHHHHKHHDAAVATPQVVGHRMDHGIMVDRLGYPVSGNFAESHKYVDPVSTQPCRGWRGDVKS